MKKFDLLMFIDDDEATTFYHKVVSEAADIADKAVFYQKAINALKYLTEQPEGFINPDIIFLDINMPRMDGWQFLKKLEELQLDEYPVIFMVSTSLDERDLNNARSHHLVRRFIQKPVTEEMLIEIKEELTEILLSTSTNQT